MRMLSENSVGVPDYGNDMTIVSESSDNVHGIYLCYKYGIGRLISDTIDKKEKYWFFATSYTIPDIYEKYDTAEYYRVGHICLKMKPLKDSLMERAAAFKYG